MEQIIEETISDSEIARMAKAHEDAKNSDNQEAEMVARFQYAHALLRSNHSQDIKHGISLLERLYYEGNHEERRDYLYYIAIGQTRLKQFNLALDCVEHFMNFEPENRQAHQLRAYIQDKRTKEGLKDLAITGGAVLAIGGLIGLGLSLAKK